MDKYFSKPIWVLGSKIPGVKCFDWISGQLAGNEIDINQLETIFSTTNDVLHPEDLIQ